MRTRRVGEDENEEDEQHWSLDHAGCAGSQVRFSLPCRLSGGLPCWSRVPPSTPIHTPSLVMSRRCLMYRIHIHNPWSRAQNGRIIGLPRPPSPPIQGSLRRWRFGRGGGLVFIFCFVVLLFRGSRATRSGGREQNIQPVEGDGRKRKERKGRKSTWQRRCRCRGLLLSRARKNACLTARALVYLSVHQMRC